MSTYKTMPKGHRSVRSQGYYRLSPVTTPTTSQYAPLPLSSRTNPLPNTYYQQSPIDNSMSQSQSAYSSQPSHQSSYPNGGPVQHPLQSSSYSTMPPHSTPVPTAPLSSIRPSSGAWTPTDDQTLMAARSQGMNWAPIQQSYFPSKTPNACRKRHERLVERRNADDWDGIKLEVLAKSYIGMRREIWQGLADLTGEKWSIVEQKCMSQGLKNLLTHARSHARRERLLETHSSSHASTSHPSHTYPTHSLSPHPLHHTQNPYSQNPYTTGADPSGEDSGIGIEDLDGDYNEGATDGDGGASDRSSVYGTGNGGYVHGHGHSSSGGSGGSRGGWQGGMNGSRLPSMDMGIDAIINRPGQGR